MSDTIPVIDFQAALAEDAPADLLRRIRDAAESIGLIQVVNHGVPLELIEDFERRIGRILRLPHAEKASLASPTGHPYRGWRQWPDDFGRLELERYSIAQFDNPADATAAGVGRRWLGLYEDANVWPSQDRDLREVAFAYTDAAVGLARRALGLYERILGLPASSFPHDEPPLHQLRRQRLPDLDLPGHRLRRGQAPAAGTHGHLGRDDPAPER